MLNHGDHRMLVEDRQSNVLSAKAKPGVPAAVCCRHASWRGQTDRNLTVVKAGMSGLPHALP